MSNVFPLPSAALHPSVGDESTVRLQLNSPPGAVSARIHLIGEMRAISYLGDAVLPRGRKARAILAYLCLSHSGRAQRSVIASLLWERVGDDQARASLRQALRELTDAFDACPGLLVADRDSITIDLQACWIDTMSLMSEGIVTSEARPTLFSLCEGRLLDGFDGISPAFDQWLHTERSRLAQSLQKQCDEQIRAILAAQATTDERLSVARKILALDPLHEQAARLAMQCLAELGQPVQALREYARCRDALRTSLDLAPSRETRALYDAIKLRASVGDGPQASAGQANEPVKFPVTPRRARLRVAVLPFNALGSRIEEHLPLAVAQDTASALSRFRWFDVIAPVLLQKPDMAGAADALQVLQGLDVDYAITGLIAGAPDRVRIGVTLHELAGHAKPVWHEDFSVQREEIPNVREHVTGPLVARIDPVILFVEGQRATTEAHRLSEATNLLLRAIPMIYSMRHDNYDNAGKLLQRAFELDPNDAMIAAWKAYWHVFHVGQGWSNDAERSYQDAETLCVRAMRLDPNNAEALGIYAHMRSFLHKDFETAQYYFERSLLLNPNLAFIWALSAPTQCYIGNPDGALQRLERYRALAPFDPYFSLFETLFTMAYTFKGAYSHAIECGRRSVAANPDFTGGYKPLIAALGHLGMQTEAAHYVAELCKRDPQFSIASFIATYPIRRDEDRDRYVAGLRLAGVPET
jgi:DNA-binding SARP family transcriptional activator